MASYLTTTKHKKSPASFYSRRLPNPFFLKQYCVQEFLAAISGNELPLSFNLLELRILQRETKPPFEIHASLNTSHWTVCMAHGFMANLHRDKLANTNVMIHQISFKPNHCMLLHKKVHGCCVYGGRGEGSVKICTFLILFCFTHWCFYMTYLYFIQSFKWCKCFVHDLYYIVGWWLCQLKKKIYWDKTKTKNILFEYFIVDVLDNTCKSWKYILPIYCKHGFFFN